MSAEAFTNAVAALVLAVMVAAPDVSPAATRHVNPGDSFQTAVSNMLPGDTVIVHEGTYNEDGRISISVAATPEAPVLITGAPGEAKPLINGTNPNHNVIVLEGTVSYVTIRGLELTGTGDGINLSGNIHHVTIEDNHIHDVTQVGLNFRTSMSHLIVRRNHIHHTHDTAEGMYIGCNNSKCRVTDSLFEQNWIHDTGTGPSDSQGDGIELKQGSYNNIIRDNVIYDTNWPCILVYGTDGNPKNVVEGNVLWNCGEAGIQVQGEAVVRNNIIFLGSAAGDGLLSQNHQATVTELEVLHNTVVGSDNCVVLRDWSGKSGMVLANNAVYCDAGDALSFIGGSTGVAVSNNVVAGGISGLTTGILPGRSANSDFADAAGMDVWPALDSPLRGAADPAYAPSIDFNKTTRTLPADVGAYETNGLTANPGWKIQPGIKGIDPADTVPPSAPSGLQAQ